MRKYILNVYFHLASSGDYRHPIHDLLFDEEKKSNNISYYLPDCRGITNIRRLSRPCHELSAHRPERFPEYSSAHAWTEWQTKPWGHKSLIAFFILQKGRRSIFSLFLILLLSYNMKFYYPRHMDKLEIQQGRLKATEIHVVNLADVASLSVCWIRPERVSHYWTHATLHINFLPYPLLLLLFPPSSSLLPPPPFPP